MDKQIIESKKEYTNHLNKLNNQNDKIANIRFILFLIIFISLIIYLNNKVFFLIPLIIVLSIIFIIVILKHLKIKRLINNYQNYLKIIDEYYCRTTSKWHEFKNNGQEFIDKNSFAKDIDLLGENSLFQLINISKSISGQRKLANSLIEPENTSKEIIENQNSISELKNNFSFALNYQKINSDIPDIEKIDFKEMEELLKKEPKNLKSWSTILLITTIITDIILVLALLNIISFKIFFIPFFIQLIISYIFNYLYDEELEMISKSTRTFSSLVNITSYIKDNNFSAIKLKKLTSKIDKGYNAIKKLIKINTLDGYRHNFLTYVLLNPTISLNFLVLDKYNKLINNEKNNLINCLEALEDIEILLSYTTIPLIDKTSCLPEITDKTIVEFQDIKHPLLNKECITNTFSTKDNINIITGSNMSGKTSFMRTIAINLVLMYNGSYVTAKSFKAGIMKIFTSIRIEDDILNGISTFYGELLRIKSILEYEKNNEPMIIFIDEIFKGTNYNDRILGAKEVIKRLSNLNCIVLITTHDFEICDIKNKKIINYHFSEQYLQDKITFDYKIKKGKCDTTNAKYLMTKLGILKEDK